MFGRLLKAILFCGIAGTVAGHLTPARAGALRATYAAVGGQTLVPYGWLDFCDRYRGECDTQSLPAVDVNLTPATFKELMRVDLWVNAHVKPITDMDHWGVIDQWDYPVDGYGDCEDYALLKRKLLMAAGFPRQGLLITVVKDTHGEGHAILTVKTNRGEFILDNLTNKIKPWTETGYRFVKRQSQTDPNVWLDLGEPGEAPLVVSR